MPDLNQLETFVLTSKLGSLAKVANKLKVSPAAISKQLTKLEKELGLQLLVRTTRKIELTEVGINYCEQCQRILEEVEAASALVSKAKLMPHGSLKVVSGRHFAAKYIIPHVKEFLLKFPGVELNLEIAERVPELNVEAIDVVIGMSITASGNAIQKRIGTTSYAFCASKSYLKQFGIPKNPEALKNHHYITHSMRLPEDELEFDHKKIVRIHPYIKVNDAESMLKLALDGLGIVKLHRYVVSDYLSQGLLQEVLAEYNQKELSIYVAYKESRFVASKVRCFIDFIIEKFKRA